MVLSKRERYIVIGVAGAVALLILNYCVYEPLAQWHDKIVSDRADIAAQQSHNVDLFDRQRKLRPIWNEITNGGLKSDPDAADSQARHAVVNWMESAQVDLKAVNPERPTNVNQFQVVSFHVTGSAHMQTLTRLLWSLETASIPVRVNDLSIKPQKEGTDDLTVDLSISTLCLPPTPPAGSKTSPGASPSNATPAGNGSASAAELRWEQS